jgi:molybdate transport system regulatory protein
MGWDEGDSMKLSTRNQLQGTVEQIQVGGVMSSVKVSLRSGETITAVVTKEAVDELGLAQGSQVTVLVKATEVMLATD